MHAYLPLLSGQDKSNPTYCILEEHACLPIVYSSSALPVIFATYSFLLIENVIDRRGNGGCLLN